MPSFTEAKLMYGVQSIGRTHKIESDFIMEETWGNDIQAQTAYLYDYYHDTHKTQLRGLTPELDSKKIPIEIKYIVNSSQTYSKDQITYHIQLKPSQECNVDYYDEFFRDRYGASFPSGLYIDIMDAKGKYNKWLVVGLANYYDPQFETYEILPCNYIIQYVYDGVKYNVSAILRSQNSYNSGVWTDNKITTIEDQQKFIVPLNRDTERIFYNQRMLIDAPVLTEPRAWVITKINRIAAKGLAEATLAQDKYDEHKDFIEIDDYGNVIGMWADYYDGSVVPRESQGEQANIYSEITYSGLKPEIKVNGGYKKFTVLFYDAENQSEFQAGTWRYLIDGDDASGLVNILTNINSSDLKENQIKVRFTGDDMYLGKSLRIEYASDSGVVSYVDVSITSL